MTRKKEIRKYCSDNGFPLGACSSIASLQADTAVEAIKWADKTMIDKACKWLSLLADGFEITDKMLGQKYEKEQLINDFKNSMKI